MGYAKNVFRFLFRGFTRKKEIDQSNETVLNRCLNVFDLTALGVGSTLGAGIYVVAGQVAKDTAGPAVTISFIIAAIASIFAGLCYAEFGSRVPKTGSAYVYSYVSVGEFMAFVIGWNLILEYAIGTASVARAWTANFDALVGNVIAQYMKRHIPMHFPGLAEYPDFFAVLIVGLLTIMISIGVKESAHFNNLFTLVNIMVVLYVIICGCFQLHISNWQINPEDYPDISNKTIGSGGFFPFGFSGVFSGASICFFAFVGFDAIATAGEEVKNPQRNIPISIVACLVICALAYFGVSAVVTLMCPYFLLDHNAPLPFVFARVGWNVAKYFIAAGSLCGLSTSLFGGLFPLPRIIYAMANDGLVFKFLGKINHRTKTPLIACIVSGSICAIMTCLFDTTELVNMMSIGTFLAYTLVGTSILLLRGTYIPSEAVNVRLDRQSEEMPSPSNGPAVIIPSHDALDEESSTSTIETVFQLDACCIDVTFENVMGHLFRRHSRAPSPVSHMANTIASYSLLFGSFGLAGLLRELDFSNYYYIAGVCVVFVFNLTCVAIIVVQPEDQAEVSFKVPLVPWVPALSLIINAYLMCKLPTTTWIRFGVWMALGFLVYFGYGIRKSSEATRSNGSSYQEI